MQTAEIECIPGETLEAYEIAFARNFIRDFTLATFPEYQIKWYHDLLCKKLDDLLARKINKLMVFMPPQRGKSELVSRRLPAYALGRNPSLKIAACSYSADLSEKFNREVQRIIDSEAYKRIFPDTYFGKSKTMSLFEIAKYGGEYRSVGVMGPLTGNKVDLGIIDDPIKDRLEAQSETFRNRLWEWYLDVFCTRLHNESVQLITMTRWHEDDLAGRLLSKEGEKWDVLSLPELREDMDNADDPRQIGEPLWPERHSLESVMDIKSMSERTFISMYQQRPSAAEGNIVKESMIRYYVALPTISKVVQSWDCAFEDQKTSDYVACTVWGISGNNFYLLYMTRGKWDFVETVRQIKHVCQLFPMTSEKLIERKANGHAIIQFLQGEVQGIIPCDPKEGKEARLYASSFVFEAGNVYFPASMPWVKDVISELLVFPNGKNDDIVDTITQFILRYVTINNAIAFHTGYGRN